MDAKDDSVKSAKKITVVANGKSLVLTLKDGQDIKAALMKYLTTSKQVSDIPFLTKESEAWVLPDDEVWFDREDVLHIGLWKMQNQGKNLVLLYRQVPAKGRVDYRYIANVETTGDGWVVPSVLFEKVYY